MATSPTTENDLHERNENILSASWDKGKLACCYYKLETMELFVTYEANDPVPDFSFLCNLVRYIKPDYIIGSGPNTFLKHLMQLSNIPEDKDPNEYKIGKSGTTPLNNFLIYPGDEKALEKNQKRILSLHLPGMPESLSPIERRHFMESVLPMNQNLVVQCLGNLLNYLDTTWRTIFLKNLDTPMVTDLKVFFLESMVLVDDCTLSSLQIFSKLHHPSSFKDDVKEGFSIFSIFNRCCSKTGTQALRMLLSQPIGDIVALNCSLNTVQWSINERNSPTILTIKKFLKKIHDVGVIFKNLSFKPNKIRDWVLLKETVHAIIILTSHCAEIPDGKRNNTILSEIIDTVPDIRLLKNILIALDKAVDLEESLHQEQFIVKPGLDEDLDEKKAHMMSIHDSLQEKVQIESKYLPSFVSQCFGYYIPEIGYVIKIEIEDENPPITELERKNLKFLTKTDDAYFFKSSLCEELNQKYGYLYPEICEHESRICQRLLKYIRENLPLIQKLVKLFSKLDYMIGFGAIAIEKSFVRPEMTSEKIIKIVKGRHILWELKKSFVTNDTHISLENENLISLLIAPNASGKSVYMKQVALIAFLAHIGSFVPAQSATIGCLDSIYSRMHIPESTYTNSSSFLDDLQQMGRVMTNSTDRSLILVDEFGKGTTTAEGQAILASCIEELSLRGEKCPITLITTHYTELYGLIQTKANISQQTFEHKRTSAGALISTFQIKTGPHILQYAAEIDGIKGFLDEILREDNKKSGYCSKAQHRELHRLKIKYCLNVIKEFSRNGSINLAELKSSLESIELKETSAASDEKVEQ